MGIWFFIPFFLCFSSTELLFFFSFSLLWFFMFDSSGFTSFPLGV